MKVIFTHNIKGVAAKGDIRNVKEGYYRNFLLPRQLAIFATDHNLSSWEEFRKKILIEREQLKGKLEEIKRRLAGQKLKIEKKVTSKGTLYGGLKAKEVADAMQSQFQVEIAEENVSLKNPIKTVGAHEVIIDFGEGAQASVSVEVVEKK